MIESYENALQIAALVICSAVSLFRAAKKQDKAWILLSFFYVSWMMGDIYWQTYLLVFGDTPRISVVSNMSWYASYIFLYMLIRQIAPPEEVGARRLLPWLGPVFAAAMAVFYMQWGQYFANLITAGLMGLLLYAGIWRLANGHGGRQNRSLWIAVLVFCILEYGAWTASCFFDDETLRNPYYWFDFLMSALFLFFLPAAKKAVTS